MDDDLIDTDPKPQQAEAPLPEAPDDPPEPFTAALHPDDAVARCVEIIQNMHGSDEMRRKVAAELLNRFTGGDPHSVA